jgi:hypothetical protein
VQPVQPVQPVDRERAGGAEFVPAVGEQPQRDGPVIGPDLAQRPGA